MKRLFTIKKVLIYKKWSFLPIQIWWINIYKNNKTQSMTEISNERDIKVALTSLKLVLDTIQNGNSEVDNS